MTDRDRDRDRLGRARSSRPRDGLGRPLPRGADGVPGWPDDVVLPPRQALDQAQRLLDEGAPFHAHEVLEATWKAAPEAERELWRGLAQLAVGLTHLARGNLPGASALLERAAVRLETYASAPPYCVDAAGLAARGRQLADALRRGPAPAEAVRLRLTQDLDPQP